MKVKGFTIPRADLPPTGFALWIKRQLPIAKQAQRERLERFRKEGCYVPEVTS